jgi:hypothetical protein
MKTNQKWDLGMAILLAFHQQAADELRGDDLSGAGEEGLGERWEALGGYGSGVWKTKRE